MSTFRPQEHTFGTNLTCETTHLRIHIFLKNKLFVKSLKRAVVDTPYIYTHGFDLLSIDI